MSCDTQLNSRTLFTIASALLSSPFFGFSFGCSSTFQCGNKHSAPNLHYNSIQACRIDIREDANTHKAIWCKYLSRSIYTASRLNFPDWFLPLTFLVFDFYFGFWDLVSQRVARFLVSVFVRSLPSCRKLHWSPFEHCSFLSTSNKYLSSFNTTQSLVTCFNFLVSGVENFVIEVSDLCFSSPSSSTSDNWASTSSDEFPCRTIPIQF